MTRLLVDFSAGFSQGAGIGRYARSVVPRALAALPGWETTLLYAEVGRRIARFQAEVMEHFADHSAVTQRRIPVNRRRLDQLWFRARVPLPVELFVGRSDIVYSPDFTAPPTLGRQPRFVTVHDLAFLIKPEFSPPGLRSFLGAAVPREVRRATLVGVVSDTTRRDVIERLGVEEDRIVLVRNGVDDRFFGAEPLGPQRRVELGLPADYLLTVGTLEPRKNHLTLFKAMRLLHPNIDLPLVVAGARGWAYDEIVLESERLQAEGRVIQLDFVQDSDLPGLYAGATAVVYPSWYEGFGLPVLEALAAGVSVVTSDAPALVEVGGDQVVTADPRSAASIAAAIEQAVGAGMMSPERKVARTNRARSFDWDSSATALATALRRLEGTRA